MVAQTMEKVLMPEVLTISEGTYKGSSIWFVFANGVTLLETASFTHAVSHVASVIDGYLTFIATQQERVFSVATNRSRTTRIASTDSKHRRISEVAAKPTSKHQRLTDIVDSSLPQRLFNKAIAERYGDEEFAITWVDDNTREIGGPYGTTELIDATIRNLDADGDPTGDDVEVSFSGPYILSMLKRLTKGSEYKGILIARLEKRAIQGTNNEAWMLV
jgi:hypothetical protein